MDPEVGRGDQSSVCGLVLFERIICLKICCIKRKLTGRRLETIFVHQESKTWHTTQSTETRLSLHALAQVFYSLSNEKTAAVYVAQKFLSCLFG